MTADPPPPRQRLLAFDWAAELYCRSRALVQRDSPQYLDLTRSAARAFANAGRGAEAAAKFLEAAAAAGASPTQTLEFRRRAAGQFLASGHIDEGMTVIRGLLEVLGMGFPPTPRRALAALLWRRIAVRLRGYRFQSRAESAIPASTLAKLDTCRTIAEGLAMVDNIRGAHFQARTLLMSLRAGEPSRVSLALSLEAGFSATSGRPSRSRALKLATKAMEIAQRTGQAQALGRATFAHGLTYYLNGEWRLGYEHCARAVEIFRDHCVGVTWDLTSAQRFQIGALHYMGALREIGARTPVLLEDARRRGDLYLATDLQCRDYHLHWLALDNPTACRRGVETAISLWSQHGFLLQHYNAMLALTHCDLYAGQAPDAWKRLEQAWPDLVRSLLMRVQVLRAEALCLRARTALALFERSGDALLLEFAARDVRCIEKEKVPWTRPLALALRAGLAWAANQYDTGVALLESAADEFDKADMSLHAAAARFQLGQMASGDDRHSARAQADDWLSRQGVCNPSAISSLFAPIPLLHQ